MENSILRLLLADNKGKIFEDPSLAATGMRGGSFFTLSTKDLIRLPAGSQLFALPDRIPVGYDSQKGSFVTVEGAHAVAAFAIPGHTLTHSASYRESDAPAPLPLFAYGAAALYKGELCIAALKVDADKRHDPAHIDMKLVKKNIPAFKKLFPKNRLITHLAECATIHGCPNAQNFFLSRYEAPLPTSPSCNAACAGCISYQKGEIRCSQPRIKFVPSAEEVSEVALYHIDNVKNAIVSFGQGCEGEPLLHGKLLEESISMIRSSTSRGTINLNTNASRPDVLSRLAGAGLDSVRVSLNSAREAHYYRYYRPTGYYFEDVMRSIKIAKTEGVFTSINYLTMPGFTDSPDEVRAMEGLIKRHRIDMIQWRNLNYDPARYFKLLKIPEPEMSGAMGIREEMARLKKIFPKLKMGYFNPPIPRAAAFLRR